MQAPPNQSLPLLHRSRSEHTRRAPADRSANFNTSLPPSRPHRIRSYMHVLALRICVPYMSASVRYERDRDEACVRAGVDCFAHDVRVRVQRHGCI